MDKMINACNSNDLNLMIIGDFNEECYSNEPSWLEKYMNSRKNLKRALLSATSTTNLNTQIDVIFTNLICYTSGTYESITSDHKPIYFCNKANKVTKKNLIDHLLSSKFNVSKPIFINSQIEKDLNINDKNTKYNEKELENTNENTENNKKNNTNLKRDSLEEKKNYKQMEFTAISNKNSKKTYVKNCQHQNSVSSLIQKILLNISKSISVEEIERILQENNDLISKLSDEIQNTVTTSMKKLLVCQPNHLNSLKNLSFKRKVY